MNAMLRGLLCLGQVCVRVLLTCACVCVCVCVCTVPQVADKLRQVELRGVTKMRVHAAESTPTAQAADLRAALQVLGTLPYCRKTEIELSGFTLTPTLAAELVSVSAQGWQRMSLFEVKWPSDAAPSMPQLSSLHSLSLATPITDTVLTQLCEWATAIDKLEFRQLSLGAPLPAGTVVPWRVASFKPRGGCSVSPAQCLEWAQLLGPQRRWEHHSLIISLTAQEVRHP